MTSITTTPEVSPVRLHHVPNWLRLRMLRAFGTSDGYTAGCHVLENAVASAEKWVRYLNDLVGGQPYFVPSWLDHWGSTVIDGNDCFVSEPYMKFPPDQRDLAVPHNFAVSTNCRLLILPQSAWNPPSTIRLLFKPNH